jgi:hypothetical protein
MDYARGVAKGDGQAGEGLQAQAGFLRKRAYPRQGRYDKDPQAKQ